MPSGGEVGPPKRSFGLGETELDFSANIDPYFRGVAIAALTPENEVEVEEAYFQTLALPQGFTLKGRALLLRHRLPERDPPARLGFPGRAAAVQGVSRRTRCGRTGCSCAGSRPRRSFSSSAPSSRAGDQFPGTDRNKNGIGGERGVRPSRRRHRRRATRGGRDFPTCGRRAQNRALRGRRFARRRGDQQLHRKGEVVGRRRGAQVGAERQSPRYRNFKLQGEYFRVRAGRHPDLRRQRAGHAAVRRARQRLLQERPVGLVRAGGVAVHAALARGLPLRPAALRDGRQRHRRERARPDRRRFSAAREPQPGRATR